MNRDDTILANQSHHIARIDDAVRRGHLTASAAANITKWLTESWYAEYRAQLVRLIEDGDYGQLDDLFWRALPFGTAGRRGPMAPVGCNAVNTRTIGETVAALASYTRWWTSQRTNTPLPSPATPAGGLARAATPHPVLKCAVAYDCRHQSRAFAELSARIMVAAGFHVYFLDGCRSTPALAFTVRSRQCQCGIMISASHNPPQDNAIKVFWDHGGQIANPHDEEVTKRIAEVRELAQVPFDEAVRVDAVEFCQQDIDRTFCDAVVGSPDQRRGPRDLRILYSPLHGVGQSSVLPALVADGFFNVRVHADHASLDPDFSKVPGHIANPEHSAVFDRLIDAAVHEDLILASDPDADRIGAAARLREGTGVWQVFNGNQLAVLLAEFLLRNRKARAELTPKHFLVSTRVTTPMLARIARHYGVRIFDDCLTGFKWIAPVIDREGPHWFIFGAEEAHGYLVGDYIRDKDAAGAAIVLAEFAGEAKSNGRTLWDELDRLYITHGFHWEQSFALPLAGADGANQMNLIMRRLREADAHVIPSFRLVRLDDFLLQDARANLLILQLQTVGGAFSEIVTCAVRPSGTEPKLKFYLWGAEAPVSADELPASKERLKKRIAACQAACLAAISLA